MGLQLKPFAAWLAMASWLALSAGLALPAAALASTQSGHSGDVSATFSFTGTAPFVKHQRLKIVRAGKVIYDQAVSSPLCADQCGPGVFGRHASSVSVRDIESDGSPDVILSLFSGGANCCFLDQVFSFDPGTMTYVETERDFAYEGAAIKDLAHNGHSEFVSSDPAFVGEFTDNAGSGAPIEILTFSARRFHDVTRQYPKQIAADAAGWLKLFHHPQTKDDTVGLIAAWAADEELLHNNKLVQLTLASEASKGDLLSPPSGGVWPSGKRFIKALNRFLVKNGYEK
jgi:hypothetical protein